MKTISILIQNLYLHIQNLNMGKNNFEKAPSIKYYTSHRIYYYVYKLYAVRGLSGVIHSFDFTKASGTWYLKDVKVEYCNNTFISDRGYISASINCSCLKQQISNWKFHIGHTRMIVTPYFSALPKQEKNQDTILTTEWPVYNYKKLCEKY